MIKGIKVMLLPNNKQKSKLFQYANTARFAYNWALATQQENYKNGGKFIQDGELRKQFTQLKKTPEYEWLNSISNNVTKQAIKDCCNAFKRFFKGESKYPNFKSKKLSSPKFYQDVGKIQFTSTHVKFEGFTNNQRKNKQKINWVRLSEHNRIPTNCKYTNPRCNFDGINWWISVGIKYESNINNPKNRGIGIDLGIKDLAICSDKIIYKNINKTNKVKKIENKIKRTQRQVSNKYENNNKKGIYKKTNNIKKIEYKLLKLNHKLTNIRHNHINKITTEIIKREPSFIVMEDLNVKGMMKNKHLAKAIQQQCFYKFKNQIQYKCNWNNIKFIEAPRFFPSSKTCSNCGYINKNLKLSDRIYICPECAFEIDRDYNASVNLMKYGQAII